LFHEFMAQMTRETEARLAEMERRAEARRNAAAAAENQRRVTIIAQKWPKQIEDAVLQRQVSIGMTREQAELAWGRPESIQETTSAAGVTEQWVYRGPNYLGFQDGRLRVIRRSR
jgi:hypothetical protein